MNRSARFWNTKQVRHALAKALACSTLLVLPSCGIPKNLRQADPGPLLPDGFNLPTSGAADGAAVGAAKGTAIGAASGGSLGAAIGAVSGGAIGAAFGATSAASNTENSSQLGIDEFFNDPTLTSLIEQAVVSNLELKVLDQNVQIARNEILARQGAYLPFLTIGGGAGLNKPSLYTPEGAVEDQLQVVPGKAFPNPLANFQLGANLFWQLDIWRQLRNSRDAAIQRYIAASETRNFFVTRLVADVAENYYRLMALDKRLENLDKTITLQEQSLEISKAKMDAGRGTLLAVQRFQAEVRKNQSEKLIIKQEVIEVENKINFLLNRYPQPVERMSAAFFDLNIPLNVGVPAQLLQNRPDIRQAERELAAAGLDVKVARARFFPTVAITAGVGYEAFNPKYLFTTPEALVYNVAGNLVAPLINKTAIRADYLSANAKQLQAVYNYQRVILNAFTEVVNRVSMVENYRKSLDIKKQQLQALEASVESADKLFQNARAEYVEVLLAQRDLRDARMVVIDTKSQQLSAIVNAYQALGGGNLLSSATLELPKVFSGWK